MTTAAFAVGAIGVILLLGVFLKFYSFKKAYPLTLLLLFVGIFVGPIMGWFKPHELLDIINPFVALALIMVLFDTGYNMKINVLLRNLSKPLLFGTLAVLLTVIIIAIPFKLILGVSWALAVLFGALLASTDLTIIGPMLDSMNLKTNLKNLLEMESAINSVLSAVIVIVVINLLKIGGEFGLNLSVFDLGVRTLLYNIFVGVGIGVLAGYMIIRVVEHAQPEEKPQIMVIGALFLAYAISEIFGASGIVTALSIGIVFGNSKVQLPRIIKSFGGEMELILVTFVYVILGAIIDFNIILQSSVLAVLLIFFIYAARYLGFTISKAGEFADYTRMIILSSPRGIVCAVLTLSYANLFPNPELIISLVFTVILVSAIGVFFIPKNLPKISPKTLK